MRVRLPLQGRIREYPLAAMGAYAMIALEPPLFHRPRGTNYGRFVTRLYKPVRYDRETDTCTCVGVAEYWQ